MLRAPQARLPLRGLVQRFALAFAKKPNGELSKMEAIGRTDRARR
jgi:hypothetical protein